MTKQSSPAPVPRTSRDEWETQYRSGRWDYLADEAERARYAALVERVLTERADTVLDVGCGSGVLRDCLGTRFAGRYVGVDWSHAALAGRDRWPGETLVCADASRLPFQGQQFDTLVLSEVLYYLDDPEAAVARMLDLLTPGGELLVSLYQPPADRHPGWHQLIRGLDRELAQLAGSAHTLVGGSGSRKWRLHILTRPTDARGGSSPVLALADMPAAKARS